VGFVFSDMISHYSHVRSKTNEMGSHMIQQISFSGPDLRLKRIRFSFSTSKNKICTPLEILLTVTSTHTRILGSIVYFNNEIC
jgi:hypothetical protein